MSPVVLDRVRYGVRPAITTHGLTATSADD